MKSKIALLLVDIQNDYFPGGSMELVGAEPAARRAAGVLQHFRERKLPVIHVAHEAIQPGATFFLPGTTGQQIHPLVAPLPEEKVIVKNHPNSFLGTRLEELLRAGDIRRLCLAGMMTHMCIDATARAAKDLGLQCTLVHDATATRNLIFAGDRVPAAQVQSAFTAALSAICDAVLTAGEVNRATSLSALPAR